MRKDKIILFVDFIVNLFLGLLLLAYSENLASSLGVPIVESSFYPNVLGGVFIGIALALLLEVVSRNKGKTSGLGFLGAITINLCGGTVLISWLLSGKLNLPIHGSIFLWSLSILLIILSIFELLNHYKTNR
jgi:hypothetical protein